MAKKMSQGTYSSKSRPTVKAGASATIVKRNPERPRKIKCPGSL